jgi:hypothetical protein
MQCAKFFVLMQMSIFLASLNFLTKVEITGDMWTKGMKSYLDKKALISIKIRIKPIIGMVCEDLYCKGGHMK